MQRLSITSTGPDNDGRAVHQVRLAQTMAADSQRMSEFMRDDGIVLILVGNCDTVDRNEHPGVRRRAIGRFQRLGSTRFKAEIRVSRAAWIKIS